MEKGPEGWCLQDDQRWAPDLPQNPVQRPLALNHSACPTSGIFHLTSLIIDEEEAEIADRADRAW